MSGDGIKQVEHTNKMGTEKISKLLFSISLPSVVAIFANNLYGVVDGIFVAKLSEKALTAISLVAPIQIIIAALGSGMAIGLNAVVSKALGEKKPKKVKDATAAAIFLAVTCYMILFVLGMFFIDYFMKWQTQDPEIISCGVY